MKIVRDGNRLTVEIEGPHDEVVLDWIERYARAQAAACGEGANG